MAISLLQSNNAGPTITTSLSVEYTTKAVSEGSLLVAEIRSISATQVVSDNVNGNWALATPVQGIGGQYGSIWFFENSTPGTITLTLSGGASGALQANIQEWAGHLQQARWIRLSQPLALVVRVRPRKCNYDCPPRANRGVHCNWR